MNFKEKFFQFLFLFSAFLCVVALCLICLFLVLNAVPSIAKIGFFDFIFGSIWRPSAEFFGIFPMIIGSLYVTAFAVFFGTILGILSAIYLAFFARGKMKFFLNSSVELLAGIPSIVYGFFGLILIVPILATILNTSGKGLLAASILLAIMILPTIILVSKTSLESVSHTFFEAGLGLGASKERVIFFIMLRAAKSGVLASVILGLGRAIGEAMAVIVVAGNQAIIPQSIKDGVRTLTTNIVLELGYATDLHKEALIASSFVLFVFILLINLLFSTLKKAKV
ncbi:MULTISPECIES: phosphate ABC transporter permease subunit PstC [unclassified Campylobacter]|uniref:phosphate ABC transporter permease subunit PstC n=1 Tax=unclassified Campylobacter TaxID=2593542 RepID=UPI001237E1DB|nr:MULTISPECIES: phosphate ABC transporter permease subunit PstC [unclassified Campylobacter]KAA6225104.1 phosphate ABC transporter permease subunit PstC [Campylobacter sp. LR196d]KAA6226118.1 phosphate ABC transporter permease subunit PstC [Campylobacter sp. LR185c]KAA6228065.1 phosphate ABC transporter permease subunit PstC [Campylobacter sp. LR286c]KAA6231318.1 phosphate ABC transporter permease subunit PstC [Campylobacter sp. LR264d]KAA6231530.1 phosphate ABC transporter permease subunit P